MKTIYKMACVAFVLSTGVAQAQHARHGDMPKGPMAPDWTAYPVLASGGGFSRSGAKFQAFNMHAMDAASYASFDGQTAEDLNTATQSLAVDENGAVAVKSGAKGGYYILDRKSAV